MLKLSKKVDYALMALMHLAQQEDATSCSARELASGYGIPADMLAKVLQRLAHEGIVVSHQGTKGGYSLGEPASAISVIRVVEAVEGSPSLTQCVSDLGTCQQFDTCNVKSPLQRLNDRVLRMLSEATLASMVEEDFRDWTDSVEPAPTSTADETAEIRLPVVRR